MSTMLFFTALIVTLRRGRLRFDLLLSRSAASLVHAALAHASRSPAAVSRSRGDLAATPPCCSTAFSAPCPTSSSPPASGASRGRAPLAGLALGQLHVWWRHSSELGWRTPAWLRSLLRPLGVVLPEDHDGHHRNPGSRVRRHLPLLRCAGSGAHCEPSLRRAAGREMPAGAATRRVPARA